MGSSLLTLEGLESNISQALIPARDLAQCLTFDELPLAITVYSITSDISLVIELVYRATLVLSSGTQYH